MFLSICGSWSQNTELFQLSSHKPFFLVEVKAILGFILCNNVLDGVQSITECAEQPLGSSEGLIYDLGFTVPSWQLWGHVSWSILKGSVPEWTLRWNMSFPQINTGDSTMYSSWVCFKSVSPLLQIPAHLHDNTKTACGCIFVFWHTSRHLWDLEPIRFSGFSTS